ncbi:MAG: lipopolysaccharide biosynthesis protein [Lacunisphaera sp.]
MKAPADSSAEAPRSGRSPRRFATFFATSLAARGIGITCQLLQVPLVVATLGAEAFGLWMTMTSITNLMQFADLGMGTGLQNRLTEKFTRGEHDEARVLFGSVFAFLTMVGVTLGAILALVVHTLDLPALFHLRDPATIIQAPAAALALCLVFCAGFPLGLAQRLAFARHEGWMFNVTQAISSVAALGVVVLGARARWSLGVLVVSAQGTLLVGNATLLLVQLFQLNWLRNPFPRLHFGAVRELLGVGAFFSVQQIVSTVMFSLPQVIISASLGAAAVTPYNLVQRLFNLFAIVQNAFLLPLWPAYAEARARGEFDWMRRALRHSVNATVLACIIPLVVCACFAPQIIRLWVGHGAVPPNYLLVGLLCLLNTLTFLQQPCLYLLVAVSEVKYCAYYSVISAVAGTVLMLVLVHRYGVPGVVLGLLLGYIPFTLIGNFLETRRYLRCAGTTPATSAAVPLL